MLYREMGKTGDSISVLGYGCMRFPKKNGKIDEELTEKQIISAIEQGVNYFDTAYFYQNSETVLGKILAKGYRDKVKIATKMPIYMTNSYKDMESTLQTSLERLQTDYIDYYLLHAFNSFEDYVKLKSLGVMEFMEKMKEEGKIKHIGFSYHGGLESFKKIIDDYDWEFCQLQYNYLDEFRQSRREGLEYAASKDIGIVIMDPLRAGSLAKEMPSDIKQVFERQNKSWSLAEWALRWVWNNPDVTLLLSGMNEEYQIKENIKIANEAYPLSLTDDEIKTVGYARELLSKRLKVDCSGCSYCMPCPNGVNIPLCFAYYNDKYVYNINTQRTYLTVLGGADGGMPSYASLCTECGRCEVHCPQQLPIRKHLKEVSKYMESFYFKPALKIIRWFYKFLDKLKGKPKIENSQES